MIWKIFFLAAINLLILANTVKAVDTYYWIGGGANNNWKTTGNWKKNDPLLGTTTSYPGSGTGDIAYIAPYNNTSSIALNNSINTLGQLIVNDQEAVSLAIASGVTLSVNGGLSIADVLQLITASSLTISGGGTLSVSGTSNFYNEAALVVKGNVKFNSGAVINLNGSTGTILAPLQAVIDVEAGGLLTCNTTTINFLGSSAMMHTAAGTINATSCIFNLSAPIAEAYADGGTFNANACTFTLGNSTSLTAIGANAGVFNANSGTVVNAGTNSAVISRLTGTVNLNSGAIINLTGNPSNIINEDAGIFTCGPTSVINLTGQNSNVNNISSAPFTLQSDGTGSATIGKIAANSGGITGTYAVQRFISAYRNYRVLSSPVNKTSAAPPTATALNLIDLSYLDDNATIPATTYGAFIGGTGTGWGTGIHVTANPLMYLYQESITPGSSYLATFTSGKNVGIKSLSGTAPNYYVTTVSTAAGGLNSSSVKVPVGNAWLMYYIGDDQRSTVSAGTAANSCTITATGYINQGTIPVYMWGAAPTKTLTYTTGTNSRNPGLTEVGNPYPSTLNLYQVYQDNLAAISSTFSQLSNTTQSFPTYNAASTGASTAGGTQYVASGQGFYVNVLSAGTKLLTFNEGEKAASTTAAIFPSPTLLTIPPNPGNFINADAMEPAAAKTNAITIVKDIHNAPKPLPMVSLEGDSKVIREKPGFAIGGPSPKQTAAPEVNPAFLHLKLMGDSVTYDECGVYFNAGWSDNYDNYDSNYQPGLAPKLCMASFSADNVASGVNAMGDYKQGKRIKLFVKAITDGLYSLQLEDIKDIDTTAFNVYLIDKQKNDSLDMVRYHSYAFNLSVADTAAFSNRFELAVEQKPGTSYQLLSFTGQKVTAGIQLNWAGTNGLTDLTLQKLGTNNSYTTIAIIKAGSGVADNYVDTHPKPGENTYRLQFKNVDGSVAYSQPLSIAYSTTAPNGVINIYPNPAKTIINISVPSLPAVVANYTANIYNTSGTRVGHVQVNSNTWSQDVSAYKLGVYIVEIKNTNGDLIAKSKFIKVGE